MSHIFTLYSCIALQYSVCSLSLLSHTSPLPEAPKQHFLRHWFYDCWPDFRTGLGDRTKTRFIDSHKGKLHFCAPLLFFHANRSGAHARKHNLCASERRHGESAHRLGAPRISKGFDALLLGTLAVSPLTGTSSQTSPHAVVGLELGAVTQTEQPTAGRFCLVFGVCVW